MDDGTTLAAEVLRKLADLVEASEQTQAELAKTIGLTQGAVSNILRNNRPRVSVASVCIIADALGYEIVLRKKRQN